MKKTAIVILLGLMLGCTQKSSNEHITSAKEYIEQQQYDAAVVELKNAVKQAPESAEARFELGRVYTLQKNYEAAEKELNRALENGYPASQVIPLLSQAYQRTGAHSALSEMDYKQEGLSATEQAKIGFYKLQSLVQLDDVDKANALIDELDALDTKSVYRGLALAYRQVIEEDFEGAIASAETLRKQSPLNQDVLKFQGQLMLREGNVAGATDVYSTYVEENPDDNQTAFLLARVLVEQGRMDEAEPIVDRLMKISQENALLNHLKAIIRASYDDYENAQSFAERAIQQGRGDPVLRLVAGFSAFQLKDFESASRHLSYIASSLPDNHPGLKMLAASQLQLGESADAGDVLGRVNQISEEDALLFSKTGYELIRSGNIKQAENLVERSEEISSSAEDLTRLGVLKLSLNNIEGVLDLEKALEQSPDLDVTKSTLATAYLATNQFDKAVELAAEWKASSPEEARAYLLAGEVLAKREDYEGAKREFNAILEFEQDNLLAKLALANIAYIENDDAAGDGMLEEVLSIDPSFEPALASYYLAKKRRNMGAEGLQRANEAWQKDVTNDGLATLVARMYLSEGKYKDALDTLSGIKADKGAPAAYWFVRGQALLRDKQLKAAEAHYDAWLTQSPNDTQATLGKLLLLDSKNNFADALAMAQAYLTKRENVNVSMMEAHFLAMSGEFAEAQKRVAKLPEETLNMPFIKSVVARIQTSEGNLEKALPLAEDAYRGVPNTRNLLLLVAIQENLGNNEQAFELISEHNTRFPGDNAAKMLLAERQISAQEADAIATYEASLKLNPNNFVVLNNLAYLYLKNGKVDEAGDLAERAVELRPEHPATLDTLAQVFATKENYANAIKYYERIKEEDFANEEIFLNYVEALLADEQKRLAVRKLEGRTLEQEASLTRLQALKEKYAL